MLLSCFCATRTPLPPSMPVMPVAHATTAPPTACRVPLAPRDRRLRSASPASSGKASEACKMAFGVRRGPDEYGALAHAPARAAPPQSPCLTQSRAWPAFVAPALAPCLIPALTCSARHRWRQESAFAGAARLRRWRGRAWAGREGQGAPSRAVETSCLGGMSVALACGVALHTESGFVSCFQLVMLPGVTVSASHSPGHRLMCHTSSPYVVGLIQTEKLYA